MNVIRWDWFGIDSGSEYRIIPIGDIHFGTRACDEGLLRAVVRDIASSPNTYWIGMGDYLDAINRSDPRFSPSILVDWIDPREIDLVGAQKNHFLFEIAPIASKCLGLGYGNHEDVIHRHYERDIYRELTQEVHRLGKFDDSVDLALGYSGWLQLFYHRGQDKSGTTQLRIWTHHGYGGGKLAGSKAGEMERVLWTRNADICLMGHTHIRQYQSAFVEDVCGKQPVTIERFGLWTGSFLKSTILGCDTYAGKKGYMPLGTGCMEVRIRPGERERGKRIKISNY